MSLLIVNPADCEIGSVTCFLSAKGVKAAEIHCEISEVYEMVQKLIRAFKDNCLNVHNVEPDGQLSVITEDLVQKVDERVHDNR